MNDTMPKSQYQKLLEVCYIQSNSRNEKLMVLFLDRQLTKLGLDYTIDSAGNVLVTKGVAKTYPCIVSHMDTVHNFVDNYIVYKQGNKIFAKKGGKLPTGIGGDDKCGVFACLYFLETLPCVKVVFFSCEESGCIGSREINHSFFENCRYIIQLDRRGKGDFIDTYCVDKTISHDFASQAGLIKKKYKFKSAHGTVTDCMKLWYNKVGISCVNISSGYYEPHTNNEYIIVDELWNSILFTKELIKTLKSKRYESLPPPVKAFVSYRTMYEQCTVCLHWKAKHFIEFVDGRKVCSTCKYKNSKEKVKIKDIINNKKDKIRHSPYTQLLLQDGQHTCSVCFGDFYHDEGKDVEGVFTCNECNNQDKTYFLSPSCKCDMCEVVLDVKDGVSYINGSYLCSRCAEIMNQSV